MPAINAPEANALITRALADEHFRAGLLNGHRLDCLKEFDFSPHERLWLLTVEAHTLEDFVHVLQAELRPEAGPRFSVLVFSGWGRAAAPAFG